MKQQKIFLIIRRLTAAVLLTTLGTHLHAQVHAPFRHRAQSLVLAEEQFREGHYRMAVQSAERFLQSPAGHTPAVLSSETDKAAWYRTVALLKTNVPGCADTALQFIRITANPVYKQRTSVALARYYFMHNRLADAIPLYEAAGIANLDNSEIADAKFELAYSYFNVRQFDMAEPLFATIREVQGAYYNAGNYYHGLLSYNKGDYKAALSSFKRIARLPEYKAVVPYYIAELYYFTGDRDKALAEALKLIREPEKLYYDNELHLLAAQCLFEQENYREALKYFEHYYEHTDRIRKEELYEMAFCYYRINEYAKAIEKFKQLSNTQDALGQTAMYLLGDCYVKTGDKNSARNAFAICAGMEFNPGQQEAALMLAGKLAHETGYHDEAAVHIRALLGLYPNSPYKAEAKTLFSSLLAKTNNYEAAYSNLQDIDRNSGQAREVYQKVAYGYAVQQLQAGDIQHAWLLLNQSLQYPADDAYRAVAAFWMSEIAYRMQQYDSAIAYAGLFLDHIRDERRIVHLSPVATRQNAYMTMGYAALQQERFDQAQSWFREAQAAGGGSMTVIATLREADAAFMRRQFVQAAVLYDKVIAISNTSDADYARLQKSILLGLQNKTAEKATLLQTIINADPASPYQPDARYELALTRLDENKHEEAIEILQPLISGPENRKTAAALLKTGFSWQELNNSDNAIAAYLRVVTDFPASPERIAALDALKSLYIQTNQPGAYALLLKEHDLPDTDGQTLDSTYYAAAETRYAAGAYKEAKEAMAQYLDQYPNGLFTVKANFYKAESHYHLQEYQEALAGYEAVLAHSRNDFSESSATKAATIAYQHKDYITAFRHYTSLRTNAMNQASLRLAYTGMMKSSYHQNWFAEAARYADTLVTLPGLDENANTEALFYKAKALYKQDHTDTALGVFRQLILARNGAISAEARYHVAEIYLKQGKLKDAENMAGETIKKSAGQDYWIVKSYILLSDILTRQKDYFNARATLQSVVKNTKIPELKEEAARKLDAVKELEKNASKLED